MFLNSGVFTYITNPSYKVALTFHKFDLLNFEQLLRHGSNRARYSTNVLRKSSEVIPVRIRQRIPAIQVRRTAIPTIPEIATLYCKSLIRGESPLSFADSPPWSA